MTESPQLNSDLDALLRQIARQDAHAFADFYDHTRARVFGMVSRVVRDPGYSEETTQDVYLQVWRNAANFNPAAGSALAWLFTLAHRRAVDRVRAEQLRPSVSRGTARRPPTRLQTWSPTLQSCARSGAKSPNASTR